MRKATISTKRIKEHLEREIDGDISVHISHGYIIADIFSHAVNFHCIRPANYINLPCHLIDKMIAQSIIDNWHVFLKKRFSPKKF